jgi:hypothetical protein
MKADEISELFESGNLAVKVDERIGYATDLKKTFDPKNREPEPSCEITLYFPAGDGLERGQKVVNARDIFWKDDLPTWIDPA